MIDNFNPTPKEFEHLARTVPFWRIDLNINYLLVSLKANHTQLRLCLLNDSLYYKLGIEKKTITECRIKTHYIIIELRYWIRLCKRKKELYMKPKYIHK